MTTPIDLPPLPIGERFKNVLLFRQIGMGQGQRLLECWEDAVTAYATAAVLADRAALAQPALWQPIETAPEGRMVVVFWLDSDGVECHNFDLFDDGVWSNYFNEFEHLSIAGAACGRPEDAPYTHWTPLPASTKETT